MYFIALQMLFGERGKYIAMVVGITFASLIMTQQPAIFIGLMSRTYSFIGDVASPDIWVMDKGVQFVEEHKPIRDTDLARVRGVAGVDWAAPLFTSLMVGKLPNGETKSINLIGLDDATLIGSPKIIEGKLTDLRIADSVIVDKEAAATLLAMKNPDGSKRPLAIGDVMEINDHRAVIRGYAKVSRNFVLTPQIFTTYSRAINYSPATRRQLTYILVKAKPGSDLRKLATDIAANTDLKAITSEDFKQVTYKYWMENTGIPINFGISIGLGFIVGAAVAGQAFFNFVRENTMQYAALKAMGVKNSMLLKMVLFQALTVGTIGYGIGVGFTSLFGLKFNDSILAFLMPPSLLLFAAGGVFLIIAVAALLAIRQIIKTDPATVFRG
ncbi:MAG: FtsX-like permease family protein [Pseudomonadota bacterium]